MHDDNTLLPFVIERECWGFSIFTWRVWSPPLSQGSCVSPLPLSNIGGVNLMSKGNIHYSYLHTPTHTHTHSHFLSFLSSFAFAFRSSISNVLKPLLRWNMCKGTWQRAFTGLIVWIGSRKQVGIFQKLWLNALTEISLVLSSLKNKIYGIIIQLISKGFQHLNMNL